MKKVIPFHSLLLGLLALAFWSALPFSPAVKVADVGSATITPAGDYSKNKSEAEKAAGPILTRLYVRASDGGGLHNGASWATAYSNLQQAIDAARGGGITEIWVAEGTYTPSKNPDGGTQNPLEFTFYFDYDIKLYGGFPRTGNPELADRDWVNHPTILTGDRLGDDETPSGSTQENARNVVSTRNVSEAFVMDGFIIQSGVAYVAVSTGGVIIITPSGGPIVVAPSPGGEVGNDPEVSRTSAGAGWYNQGAGGASSPTIVNCVFRSNLANYGGAMLNRGNGGCSPTLINCLFVNNTAGLHGGALYNVSESGNMSPRLINCTFSNNSAEDGRAIYTDAAGSPSIVNCIFTGIPGSNKNVTTLRGTTAISHSLLPDSGCPSRATCSSMVYNQNPLFVSGTDFHLQPGSPAIDAGTSTDAPGSDFEGNDRPLGTAFDMGIYEITPCALPQARCRDVTNQIYVGFVRLELPHINNGSTTPCGLGSMNLSRTHFYCDDLGSHTVTLTVTDVNGNSSSCESTVTIIDELPPEARCEDITVELEENGKVRISSSQINFHSYDPCQPLQFELDKRDFDCDDVGTDNTVTLTVTDLHGNSSQCEANVTVVDEVAPTARCQAVTLELDYQGTKALDPALIDDGSSDGCGIASLQLSEDYFNCQSVGVRTVQLTVTDINGNSNQCEATLTVVDRKPPEARCRNATVQLADNGQASITTALLDNGSFDACGVESRALSRESFNCGDVGMQSVTLTVTDVNENSSQCEADVTVIDEVAPIAICQDVTIQLDEEGEAVIEAAQLDGGSTDACGIGSRVASRESFTCEDAGFIAQNVTLTVTDTHGNSSQCMAKVNVRDVTPPTARCKDASVELDFLGRANLDLSLVDAGSSDLCGIAFISSNQSSFRCEHIGDQTIQLTFTDFSNNSAQCQANVTVVDHRAPEARCRNASVQLADDSQVSITTALIDNGSFDACGVESIVASRESFSCGDLGTQSVTLTVTDVNGNSSQCESSVLVTDGATPTALCRDVTVWLNADGLVDLDAEMIDNGSDDGCGIASMSLSRTTFDCESVGDPNTTTTLEVTDLDGNVGACVAGVKVRGLPCNFRESGGIGCSSRGEYDADAGRFVLTTNGCDGGNPYNDEQGFFGYEFCGNGAFSFRVNSLSAANAFTGIALRTGVEAGDAKVEVLTNLSTTARAAVRTHANTAAWPMPLFLFGQNWFKMERTGNQVRVYTSTNGQTWTILMVRNLTLPSCVYIGMAAYGPGAVTATFSNVVVNGTGGSALRTTNAWDDSSQERSVTSDFRLPTSDLRLPIYPNPSTGRLTVELPSDLALDGATLEVLDSYGRRVWREPIRDHHQQLDLHQLVPGVYFVRLIAAHQRRWVERVLLQTRP